MIKINYDKKWKDLINKKMLKEILNIFIKELFETELELSLYITDDFEIQKLNKTFRNKNSPTDILSWAYNDNNFEIGVNCRSPLGGEIVISGDRVRKQSIGNGWDFTTEIIRLLAHGSAHIAGFDHDNSDKDDLEMLEIEIKLLKLVGITNIY